MRLLKIQLRNVKSYGDGPPEIEFAPGVNFLSGLNGSGKSTIIEAIGYALFGVLNSRKEDFIRRGAKSGAVTVWFEHENDEYRVVRRFGSTEAWVIYCKDDVTIEKRDDVLKFLCQSFGVTDAKALENAFSYMIGVPQGTFTAAFKMTPADRKRIFDGIICVDKYSRAAGEHAAVKNQLVPRELAALAERLAAARTYIEEHQDDPKRLEDAERRLKELGEQVRRASEKRVALQDRVKKLLEVKAGIDKLDRQIQALEVEIRGADDARKRALQEVERARKAAEVCARTEKAHRTFLKAETELAGLEKKREQRDALAKKAQDLDRKIAADKEAVEGLDKEIQRRREDESKEVAELKEAEAQAKAQDETARNAEMEARKATAAHESAANMLEAEKRREREFLERLERARKAAEAVGEHAARAAELEKALEGFDEIEAKAKAALAARSTELKLNGGMAEISAEIKTHQQNKKELADQVCPFIKEQCDRVRPQVFDGMIAELRDKAKRLSEEVKSASEAAAAADRAEKKLEGLKEKRDERKRSLEAARREREKARTALEGVKTGWGAYPDFPAEGVDLGAFDRFGTSWAAALDRKGREEKALLKIEKDAGKAAERARSSADAQIKAIEDARKRLEKARKEIKNREEETDTRRKNLNEAPSRRASLAKELKTFGTLDSDMAELRGTLKECRPEHDAFAASEPIAKAGGKWVDEAAGWAAKGEDLRKKTEVATKKRAEASAAYDPEEAERVTAALAAAQQELGGLEKESALAVPTRDALAKSVEKLRKEERAAERAERERKTLERFLGVLEDAWDMLRKLGPRVSKRLLDGISVRANRIFGVLHDAPGRLLWTGDYEVRFRQGESELPFSGLSGGEQMSAALSIQMAMARDFAGSSFCVFDEPTVHLDGARRGRLPGALRDAATDAGFVQTFVVSHDDTFGPHVDHEVQLQKTVAGTQVVG